MAETEIKKINGRTVCDQTARDSIPKSASDIGADSAGTGASKVTAHNISLTAHADIRVQLQNIADQLNAFLNVDDETRNELSEVLDLIDANKELIASITTNKVNVKDIIDNLTTNVSNKPLSAAQGVALKKLIDELQTVINNMPTSERFEQLSKEIDDLKENGVGGGGVFIVELTTYESDNGLTEYKSSASVSEIYEAYTKGKTILCNFYERGAQYTLAECSKRVAYFSRSYQEFISGAGFSTIEEIRISEDDVVRYITDTSADEGLYISSPRPVQNKVVTAKFEKVEEEVEEKFNEMDGKFDEIKNSRTHYSVLSWETIYQENVEFYEGQGALTKGADVEIGKSYNLLIKEPSTGTVVVEEVCVAMPAEEEDMEIGIVLMGSTSGVVFIHPEYFEMLGAYGMVQLITSSYTGALNVSVQAEKEVVKTLDAKYLPPFTLGVHTDGLIYIFADGEPVGVGVQQSTVGGDVLGNVDANKVITLTGDLPSGEYVLKYEMADGSLVTIGTLDTSENTTSYTNQIPISINADGTQYVGTNGEKGYKTGYRISISEGLEKVNANSKCTGFIPATRNSVLRIKNIPWEGDSTHGVVAYNANFEKISSNGQVLNAIFNSTHGAVDEGNGVRKSPPLDYFTGFIDDSIAYIRICSTDINENSILTVDEPIVD